MFFSSIFERRVTVFSSICERRVTFFHPFTRELCDFSSTNKEGFRRHFQTSAPEVMSGNHSSMQVMYESK
jgi:hypothetical protein